VHLWQLFQAVLFFGKQDFLFKPFYSSRRCSEKKSRILRDFLKSADISESNPRRSAGKKKFPLFDNVKGSDLHGFLDESTLKSAIK
jgi:hypothetical protein